MRVFVYWNLHRELWSVKALDGPNKGRVIAREDFVLLSDATGKVSEAGRLRVLREGKKNVHAGIVGVLEAVGFAALDRALLTSVGSDRKSAVTYNPRKYTRFVHKDNEAPFEGSEWFYLGMNRYAVPL